MLTGEGSRVSRIEMSATQTKKLAMEKACRTNAVRVCESGELRAARAR